MATAMTVRTWRLAVAALTAMMLVPGGPLTGEARAQAANDDILKLLENDLTAIGVNTPIWLAQHLPAMMPSSGIGAGSGLSDDSGAFKFGVFTRIGMLNNFKDVGYGLKLADIESELPNLLPWPQIGLVAGIGLGDGLEVGADVQFIPALDIAGEGIELKASLLSIAGTLRWRLNKAKGIIPAVVIGLGASYYTGSFEVGAGFEEAYTAETDEGSVGGTYSFSAAPGVDWSLFQLAPEVRVGWDLLGVLRPYVGIGLGVTFGTVSDSLKLKAVATIDEINGQPVTPREVVYEDRVLLFETTAAKYTLRPHLGLDILLGPAALTVQADFAVMGKDEINSDFSSAAGSFDVSDPGFLFSQNSNKDQSNAAVVLTVALRVQF